MMKYQRLVVTGMRTQVAVVDIRTISEQPDRKELPMNSVLAQMHHSYIHRELPADKLESRFHARLG